MPGKGVRTMFEILDIIEDVLRILTLQNGGVRGGFPPRTDQSSGPERTIRRGHRRVDGERRL